MPGIQMIPHMMAQRPLFPAAVATSAMSQQKPTFPAYSNATISAPPTVGASSTSTTSDAQKPPTIPQSAGTASKIMHPPEDVSLEELRARKPRYKQSLQATASPHSSASSTPTSAASSKANESKMVQAAQEVSRVLVNLLEPDRCVRVKSEILSNFSVRITFLSQFALFDDGILGLEGAGRPCGRVQPRQPGFVTFRTNLECLVELDDNLSSWRLSRDRTSPLSRHRFTLFSLFFDIKL